jgi:Flp pilus assembly protein TadG
MHSIHNEHGSVIVFVTLMIVLLLIMVGIGLDTGQLTATRSQGQAAVDAAALAAVSGLPVPSNPENEVNQRVAAFNARNDYVKNSSNPIDSGNITYVQYDEMTDVITTLPGITSANGVRVALEAGRAITTPVFLTPLLNLFGQSASSTVDVNVSAVAVLRALPSVPIAISKSLCSAPNPVDLVQSPANNLSCWTNYLGNPVDAGKVQALFVASETCSGLPNAYDLFKSNTPIHLKADVGTSVYGDARVLLGRCWIVPVVNTTTCSMDVIDSWAKICPTAVSDTGIKANLTCDQDQSLFRVRDNLCFSPRLVRDTKSGM